MHQNKYTVHRLLYEYNAQQDKLKKVNAKCNMHDTHPITWSYRISILFCGLDSYSMCLIQKTEWKSEMYYQIGWGIMQATVEEKKEDEEKKEERKENGEDRKSKAKGRR